MGAFFGYWGSKKQELFAAGSVPPQEITLPALIRNGPGENRHVTLTDFEPGGYVVQENGQTWSQVWVALSAAGREPDQIEVVARLEGVHSAADVQRSLRNGRVSGICSAAPRSRWGAALRPRLERANDGRSLGAAWEIRELRETPKASVVTVFLTISVVGFAGAIVLSLAFVWKVP